MKTAVLMVLLAAPAVWGAGMRAGVARREITPKEPLWMSGYASRNHPSTGVAQPLWARAMAIEGSGGRVVIVSTDIIGLPLEVANQVAARARQRFGLERSRLVLNSSHTHTGPVIWDGLITMFDLPAEEQRKLREYAGRLAEDLESVIGEAIHNLAPAEITYGFGEAGFAVNRREPTPRGVRIGVNPAGPVDHEVPVIAVRAGGQLRAVLFGYACHNTTLGGDFYELTGDYAGYAEARLEEQHPGATAMFLQLCGGDQNPNPRNTLELAQEHGAALAAEVERVLRGDLKPLSGTLRAAYTETRLPFTKQPRPVYEADAANTKTPAAGIRRARQMMAAIDAGTAAWDTAYPVQAIRFGRELTLVALAGEVVVDYALRIKREHPGEHLIVAGYSNGVMCYIPTERVLAEGGYEAVDNLIYYGKPGPFAPGVEERVMAAVRRVLK